MPPSDEFKQALRAGDLPEAFMMAMGKATELNITTRVIRADGSISGDSNPAQTLHTRFDLLSGTIENEVGEEFFTSSKYKDLQHFHQQQVALGNRKIHENFESLQQLFRLLVTLQQYNRLNNSEEPLNLAFLEVPTHVLPAERVVTTLKTQEAILESFLAVEPPMSEEAIAPIPPIPPKPSIVTTAATEVQPKSPRSAIPSIPSKPMVALGVAATAAAIGHTANASKNSSKQESQEESDKPLSFLDSFAALDLDDEPDPIMSLSDLEVDDWEAPTEISPAQRLSQNTTEAYIPSLQDFDHDEPETDDVLDLDDLLVEDAEPPLDDLLGTSAAFEKHLVREEKMGSDEAIAGFAALTEKDELTGLDSFYLSEEDIPSDFLSETEATGNEPTMLEFGGSQPEAAIDPDLDSLLAEADATEGMLEGLAIFDDEDTFEPSIADASEPVETMAIETVMADTSLDDLLEAADAVTLTMTTELLSGALDDTTTTSIPEVEMPEAIAHPPEDTFTEIQEIQEIEEINDNELLSFINQDWQSFPGVAEITSLEDDGDPSKTVLQPLSDEELAELDAMDEDDDWQPLAPEGSAPAPLPVGELAFDLEDEDEVQPLLDSQGLAAEDEDFDLAIDDDWEPLGDGAIKGSIDLGSLLPPEDNDESLKIHADEDLTAIATTEELNELNMDEVDLDLEMPLSQGDDTLGMLDSVDASVGDFPDDDIDDALSADAEEPNDLAIATDLGETPDFPEDELESLPDFDLETIDNEDFSADVATDLDESGDELESLPDFDLESIDNEDFSADVASDLDESGEEIEDFSLTGDALEDDDLGDLDGLDLGGTDLEMADSLGDPDDDLDENWLDGLSSEASVANPFGELDEDPAFDDLPDPFTDSANMPDSWDEQGLIDDGDLTEEATFNPLADLDLGTESDESDALDIFGDEDFDSAADKNDVLDDFGDQNFDAATDLDLDLDFDLDSKLPENLDLGSLESNTDFDSLGELATPTSFGSAADESDALDVFGDQNFDAATDLDFDLDSELPENLDLGGLESNTDFDLLGDLDTSTSFGSAADESDALDVFGDHDFEAATDLDLDFDLDSELPENLDLGGLESNTDFDLLGDLDTSTPEADEKDWFDKLINSHETNGGTQSELTGDFDELDLSNEVLNSIEELDQATANLMSSDDMSDQSLFQALDISGQADFLEYGISDDLGDLGDFNIDDLDAADDSDLDALAIAPPVDNNDLSQAKWDDLEHGFDELDEISLTEPEAKYNDPIDLGFEVEEDLLPELTDDSSDIDLFGDSNDDNDDWDNLTLSADSEDAGDWNTLKTVEPVGAKSTTNPFEMDSLDGLTDLDNDDLSGLADFDLEAIESGNSDDDFDFDIFGDEDNDDDAFDLFLEPKK